MGAAMSQVREHNFDFSNIALRIDEHRLPINGDELTAVFWRVDS